MPQPLRLSTVLEPRGPACAVVLTDEQVAGLGGSRRPAVLVTIAGRSVRARVGVMGGENLVGLSKGARSELGVEIGDSVDVEIRADEEPREVDVPAELAEALASNPAASAAFDKLPYSHRKEHARAVADAKRPETRTRRVAAVLEALTGR